MAEGQIPKDIKSVSAELETAQKRRKILRESPFEKKLRKRRMEDLKYFDGSDQGWDETGVRGRLKAKDRAAITLNRIMSIFRLIQGNRPKTKTAYTAVEDGDKETAEIMNATGDHVDRENMWSFMEEEWFRSGALLMRSVLEIFRDFGKDPRGEVGQRIHDGGDCYFDNDAKDKARTGGKDLLIEKTVDPEEAKRTWPHKKREIEQLIQTAQMRPNAQNTSDTEHDTQAVDEYTDPNSAYYDAETKKLFIDYYWWKEFEHTVKIIDFGQVEFDPEAGISGPKVMTSKKNYYETKEDLKPFGDRFAVMVNESARVRYLVFSQDIEFERGGHPFERDDGQPTQLSQNFPFICFEPERIFAGTHDELTSLIDPMKDPQKYHNKLASAILEIIGTTAHSGYDYEAGSISDVNKKKLLKKGSSPGQNIEWERGALEKNRMRKKTPGSPPVAHMAVAKDLASELLDISGIQSLADVESVGKGASFETVDIKQQQGRSVVSWIYESFRFFNHIRSAYVRDAIQASYTYEKTIRITGTKERRIVINQKEYDYQGAVTQTLNDVTIGKYDITSIDEPMSPSLRIERFKLFADLVKSGFLQLPPPVLMTVLLHLMDDPDLKQVIEDEMGEFAEAAAQQEEPPKAKKKVETTKELKGGTEDGGEGGESESAEIITKEVVTEEIEGSPEAIAA